jgi:hypothetical protein
MDGQHAHDLSAVLATIADGDQANAAAIADLAARVAALEAPPAINSVRVTSQADLLAQLADDSVDEIVVATGTPLASLRIDGDYANRTRPIVVRAETIRGVEIKATSGYSLLVIEGAHDQRWVGFQLGHGNVDQMGALTVGQAFGSAPYAYTAPYNLTFDQFEWLPSLTGPAQYGSTANATAHGIYISDALDGGPRNIEITNAKARGGHAGLSSWLQMYGSRTSPVVAKNGQNVHVADFDVAGYEQTLLIYDNTITGLLVERGLIDDSGVYSVRWPYGNGEIRDVTGDKPMASGSPAVVTDCTFG